MYVTAGRIAVASAYGRDVYDNALEKLSSNTTSYDEITFLLQPLHDALPIYMRSRLDGEGNLITETRNDTESDDESDSESIMMSKKDMENLIKQNISMTTLLVRKRYMTFVT